jgi:maleylpyruvate isomerase
MRLYGYWRSSAAYRVRIALNLKGLACEHVALDLRAGEQRREEYLARNPQGLVPFLEDGEVAIGQSLAILEYLEERYPVPPLLPGDPQRRALARELACAVACDTHPLNNLRVLKWLKREMGQGEEARQRWYEHWIAETFEALERRLATTAGRYCLGDEVTLADVFLIPQVANARRYACNLEPYGTIRRVEAACLALPAFIAARPEAQPDADRPA